ncbi:MAG: MetQ/NlpA family ABC transporter substrate-binding protein [Syntrophomonadaceae bacterium]|jgi:D-methionine transport system substrate-binding protein|nr:MetQ/NlpA family ABC transporter substrate-binding protein [Syntrophomonadaceae bacterium]
MKKFIVLVLSLVLMTGALVGCSGDNEQGQTPGPADQTEKLVVGATAKPHAEILEVVKPVLEADGVELEIKEFTDYVLINPALAEGQIDANFFQHIPYLDDYNSQNQADLKWIAKIHNEPMGVYSNTLTDIDSVSDGATVGIPNDATNGGRALMVLESAGLIKLKEGVGVLATEQDIIENPKNIKITMMDAPMLPRALEDLDLCVINSNYALEANLNPVEDSIFMEPKDSPFANVLVVRPEDENKESIQKLAKAMQSPEVKQFLEENYPGACVPSF